ncbi:MAG: (d)CMP kinase [Saprospiraceae bacterium]
MSQKKIVIAIDGFSSCGKSTLAKDLAQKLNYTFIDSGAMYRSVSLYLLNNEITISKTNDYSKLLEDEVKIGFSYKNGERITILNGKNVESQIRSPQVADVVSEVATNSSVRKFLVTQQQELGKEKGVIMDGRDIGTVVFPDAELKLFITADVNIRAQRRYEELKNKKVDISFADVKTNLQSRDQQDSTRRNSPLLQAEDSKVIDTSYHTRASQMDVAMEYVLSIL